MGWQILFSDGFSSSVTVQTCVRPSTTVCAQVCLAASARMVLGSPARNIPRRSSSGSACNRELNLIFVCARRHTERYPPAVCPCHHNSGLIGLPTKDGYALRQTAWTCLSFEGCIYSENTHPWPNTRAPQHDHTERQDLHLKPTPRNMSNEKKKRDQSPRPNPHARTTYTNKQLDVDFCKLDKARERALPGLLRNPPW